MFSKVLFKIRYRQLEHNPNPYKQLAEDLIASGSHSYSRKIENENIGRNLEHLDNLKNEIDEYGDKNYPEEPPFDVLEIQGFKRTVIVNRILTALFIIAEGAFNYLAVSSFVPGGRILFEFFRIIISIIISISAYKLIDLKIKTHFDYISLRYKSSINETESIELRRFKSANALYTILTIILFSILISLGVVREFVIAGGVRPDIWLLIVTIGIAIVIAFVLGIQGEETDRVINQYHKYKIWNKLRKRIHRHEIILQEKFDKVDGCLIQTIEKAWGWMHHAKRWIVRNYDEDDREINEADKKNLIYINKDVFKDRMYSDTKIERGKIVEFKKVYDKLKNYWPHKPVGNDSNNE